MRRVHQLAGVVLVITFGVDKLFDALASGSGPTLQPLYAAYGSRPSLYQDDDDFGDDA